MSDNRLIEKDSFSEIFKDKLEYFEMPVDEACWDEIEAKMKARDKRRVIPFWGWLGSGVAVASLALLLMMNPLETDQVHLAQQANSKQLASKKTKVIDAKTLFEAKEQVQTPIHTEEKKTVAGLSLKSAATRTTTDVTHHETSVLGMKRIKKETPDNTPATKAVSAEKKESTATTSSSTAAEAPATRILPDKLVPKQVDNEPKPSVKQAKKHRGWALAAAFGPGMQSSDNGQNGTLMRMGNSYDLGTSSTLVGSNYYSTESYSDISYHPGLSFGLTVRKNLTDHLAVESGLMYTYLNTSMKGQSWYTYDAEIELHYLGIPVNLIVNLYNKHRWTLYASGGGMLEKGIRSTYLQHQYLDNGTVANRTHSGIDGLQWSLNSAVGVSYELQRGLGLYFEPGLSYFFDNAQPTSIRTENPVSVNFKAGLRLTFN